MTAFSKGQQASLTLDEQDILTITGSCKLQITSTPKPTYETLTNGGTIGPFGAVTLVILTGLGDGTFIQSPSNYAQAVSMVDMSPAQIAAPTAAQLAATNVLYQLNAPPYTIYQSNGTGMTVFGGGVSQFASLTDASTAPLPTTNTPLATALATKQAALTSGTNIKTVNGASILGSGDLTVSGAGATLVTFNTALPLDGNKYSAQQTLTTNPTWTVGATNEAASPSYYVEVVPNGHTPTFSGFLNRSGTWNAANIMQVNAGIQNSRPQVILFDTGIPCAPVFSAQSAPAGVSGVAYSYTFVASSAVSYALASGTLPAGLTLNTSMGVLSGTPSSITSYTFVISATNVNGTTNSTSQTVVINPPAPVFSAQSAPAGTSGVSYSYTFVASNTTSFAVASGAVPVGLTLNTSTGVLSGTPTTPAAYTFVIAATGAGGTTSSTSQSVTVAAPSITESISSITTATPIDIDMTASAFADWVVTAGFGNPTHKTSGSIIGTPVLSNMTYSAGQRSTTTGNATFSYSTDATPTSGAAAGVAAGTYTPTTGSLATLAVPFACTGAVQHAKVWIGVDTIGPTATADITASLSDSGATPTSLTVTTAGGYGSTGFLVQADFLGASGATFSLTVKLNDGTASAPSICLFAAAVS